MIDRKNKKLTAKPGLAAPSFEQIWMLRHGEASEDHPEGITPNGVEQAKRAAHFLSEHLTAKNTVLLSSTAGRALTTAGVISEELGIPVYPSDVIRNQGEDAGKEGRPFDPMAYVERGVIETGLVPAPNHSLVVVTHAPAVALSAGIGLARVGHAQPHRIYPQ